MGICCSISMLSCLFRCWNTKRSKARKKEHLLTHLCTLLLPRRKITQPVNLKLRLQCLKESAQGQPIQGIQKVLKDRKDSSQVMVFEINGLKICNFRTLSPEESVPAPVALRQFLQTTKEEILFNLQFYTDI